MRKERTVAEVEIHTGHPHEGDELGKKVGVVVGVIGILLAVVTIGAHRAHTAAVVLKTEANDQWAYYQAKKIREHQSSVGLTVLEALGTDAARVKTGSDNLSAERDKYAHEAGDLKKIADAKEDETRRAECSALRLDMGEGFLELGLVLSSLYFLSRNALFPMAGGIAALVGIAMGALGFLY
jgi:type II secretory pathway pseudopilin PulG